MLMYKENVNNYFQFKILYSFKNASSVLSVFVLLQNLTAESIFSKACSFKKYIILFLLSYVSCNILQKLQNIMNMKIRSKIGFRDSIYTLSENYFCLVIMGAIYITRLILK